MRVLIHHIIVIWDECEHISPKRLKDISKVFFKYYVNAFPEGAKTDESPIVISTRSQIIPEAQMKSFLHNGEFLQYKGINKDLAIVKYCATGVIDEKETFRFILDEMRRMRDKRNEPPLRADSSCLTVFITSDWANGMLKALDHIYKSSTKIRSPFMSYRVPKLSGENHERIAYAGNAVGVELKKRFLKHENGGVILDLER